MNNKPESLKGIGIYAELFFNSEDVFEAKKPV